MTLALNSIESTILLDAAAATGPGLAVRLSAERKAFQMIITGTATAAVEVSNDGANWEELFESTASEGVDHLGAWAMYRANVKAWTSGTVTVLAKVL